MTLAYVGIGSNLHNPLQQVQQALQELQELPHTELKKVSRLYQSAAIGPEQDDFINAAALLDTNLQPLQLLDALQTIEQVHQRERIQHWGPRTLDLDILLYADDIIASERLTVPHAFLTRRAFVLLPLLDINPDLQLPDGSYIKDYLAACADQVIQPLNLHAQPEISQ